MSALPQSAPELAPADDLIEGVREVTETLRAALERFTRDSKLLDLAERQVPDAKFRLSEVMRLTDDAAHRTMDLVEQSGPLADRTAREAARLLKESRANPPGSAVGAAVEQFLQETGECMGQVRANLAEVLLTQGYQDLSGQIIRGVMHLVDELEVALGTLVNLAGRPHDTMIQLGPSATDLEGPAVPGIVTAPKVSGQQDVDALLSNLGM